MRSPSLRRAGAIRSFVLPCLGCRSASLRGSLMVSKSRASKGLSGPGFAAIEFLDSGRKVFCVCGIFQPFRRRDVTSLQQRSFWPRLFSGLPCADDSLASCRPRLLSPARHAASGCGSQMHGASGTRGSLLAAWLRSCARSLGRWFRCIVASSAESRSFAGGKLECVALRW